MNTIKETVAESLDDTSIYTFESFGCADIEVRQDPSDGSVRLALDGWLDAADLRKLAKLAKRLAESLERP